MTDQLRRLLASIRTRLLLTIVLVLAIGVGATALVTRQVLLSRVDARISDQLQQEANELRLFAEQGLDPETGTGFGRDTRRLLTVFLTRSVPTEGEVLLSYVSGQPFQRTAQEVPYRIDTDAALTVRFGSLDTSASGRVTTPAGAFDYLAVPIEGDEPAVFLVGVFREVVAAEVEQTVEVTAWVAAGSLLAGLLVAFALARRILDPLERVTTTARDITETDLSRRLEVDGHDEVATLSSTFNAMLDRLEGAFAQQRQFIDDAGHELRTPITVVRGHLELLDDEPDQEERRATVALLLDELDRMHRIVEDLLTLAKTEQPDFVRRGTVDLDELTTSVLRKARALSTGHDWHLDEVGIGHVHLDGQRVTQALVALVDNAVKYTPVGTRIAVGSRIAGDDVRLWVRDEGPGIDPQEHDRIFDRFARGSDGPRRSEGAGLGLSIVRAIAQGHDGEVVLDSAPGHGTTLTLVLPFRDDARSTAEHTTWTERTP